MSPLDWSGPFGLQPNDNVDPRDLCAGRRLRQTGDGQIRRSYVEQQLFALDVVVEVVRDVGIEVGPMTLNGDFTQETGPGKLVEGIVDGGE